MACLAERKTGRSALAALVSRNRLRRLGLEGEQHSAARRTLCHAAIEPSVLILQTEKDETNVWWSELGGIMGFDGEPR